MEKFVTRKITYGVARIKLGIQNKLELGNLDSNAIGDIPKITLRPVVDASAGTADDYVIATKETRTVREFVEAAFHHAGIKLSGKVQA